MCIPHLSTVEERGMKIRLTRFRKNWANTVIHGKTFHSNATNSIDERNKRSSHETTGHPHSQQ